MQRKGFSYLMLLTVCTAVVSAFLIQYNSALSRLAAGGSALSGYLLMRYAGENLLSLNHLEKVKIIFGLVETGFELILVISILVTDFIPEVVSITVLTSLLVFKMVQARIIDGLRMSIDPSLDYNWRISILILFMFLSFLDPYMFFYGALAYISVIVYDILGVLYNYYEEVKQVQLSNIFFSN